MATTRVPLHPFSAEFPSSNYPALMTVNARPVLAFDASTAETCYWIKRDAADGTNDTASGDCYVLMAEIREA